MKKYITPLEFKEMFGYTVEYQANLRRLKKLPYTKMGNRVFYPLLEIEKMLENNMVNIL